MIQSVFIGSDAELVTRLINLHKGGPGVLDVTFGAGRFWRSEYLVGPGHESHSVVGLDSRMADLSPDPSKSPQVVGWISGDYTALPVKNNSFDVVICDPPFRVRGGVGSVMKNHYWDVPSYESLMTSLEGALPEFLRVLRPRGFVLLKMMDLTEGRRRRFTHIDVANLWAPGLRLDDLVVKVAPQSMESPSWTRQYRTRSSHTYFMIFRPIRLHPKGDGHRKVSLGPKPLGPKRETNQ